MNEIARFQRLSRVSSAGLVRPGRRRTAALVDRAPGEPVERRVVRAKRRATRSSRSGGVDAVVVREGDEVRARSVPRARVARARESPRGRVQPLDLEGRRVRAGRRRAGRPRSGRRAGRGSRGASGRRATRAAARARSTRSTVATTRSNEGSRSSPRPYANARAARLRAARRPQRRPLRRRGGRERAAARPCADLELIVVDDALDGRDAGAARRRRRPAARRAPERGAGSGSPPRSIAASSAAAGRYVARLDADDVALPERLERQLARTRGRARRRGRSARPCSTSTQDGAPGDVHRCRAGAAPLRWHALFSSPFFHPTVLVDRAGLDRARAALRPGVPRERGLRPVDAAARASPTVRTSPSRSSSSACTPARPRCGERDLQQSFQRARSRCARSRASRPSSPPRTRELAWRLGAAGRRSDEAGWPACSSCSLHSSVRTARHGCARQRPASLAARRRRACARAPWRCAPASTGARPGAGPAGWLARLEHRRA